MFKAEAGDFFTFASEKEGSLSVLFVQQVRIYE